MWKRRHQITMDHMISCFTDSFRFHPNCLCAHQDGVSLTWFTNGCELVIFFTWGRLEGDRFHDEAMAIFIAKRIPELSQYGCEVGFGRQVHLKSYYWLPKPIKNCELKMSIYVSHHQHFREYLYSLQSILVAEILHVSRGF